ncbi:MAG: hypothetical protein CSA84_05845 [Actinomycetales bacterium]|nr:MAG: hypothetical protein CSA84_05845 [Actinomycetales bacterium]
MALSDREQKLLEQMEQALYAEDPRFAARIRTQSAGQDRRRLLVGGLGILIGLGLILVGVFNQLTVLGAAGFAVMVAAGVYALAPARKSGPTGVVDSERKAPKGSPKKSKSRGSFMQRMEQRWDNRNDPNHW